MVINPARFDAYIARKGLVLRVGDAEWEAILQRVAGLFGRELWHRCRLIHQGENPLRRYCTVFPGGVPRPYRYIYYLEFVAFSSPRLSELQQWLNGRGIVWRECRQFDVDTRQQEIVGLQIFGYDPSPAA